MSDEFEKRFDTSELEKIIVIYKLIKAQVEKDNISGCIPTLSVYGSILGGQGELVCSYKSDTTWSSAIFLISLTWL